MSATMRCNRRNKGVAFITALLFVLVFSALAVSMAGMSGANVQLASNQHRANTVSYAAQSALACGQYIIHSVALGSTNINYVTDAQAETAWTTLCTYLQTQALDGKPVAAASRFSDAGGSGDQIFTLNMRSGSGNITAALRFYRYDGSPKIIKMRATGSDGTLTRRVSLAMDLSKSRDVLTYALAGRGRMWLTGDTTIHGDIFSNYGRKWNAAHTSYTLLSMAPFNMTSDSRVEGTVNTVLSYSDMATRPYDLETLSSDNKPLFTFGTTVYDKDGGVVTDSYGTTDEDGFMVDSDGNPVYDASHCRVPVNYANRVHSMSDELQGYHENVNYGQTDEYMSGLKISDYDTSMYKSAIPSTTVSATGSTVSNGTISTTGISTVTEYFPHASGNYGSPSSSGSRRLTRYKFENKTFSNVTLPSNKNALFKNCTFNNVLYIDCGTASSSTNYNNVRFENCTFNGPIITNVPQAFNWQANTLYFTGAATFNNQSSIQEATILAPHFNVNLGNTNPEQSDNNVLTGAIVGGIVDVRGNAQIYGTIISMADTSSYTSGYVTNIGATLNDGGSETTELGDIGVISITPEEDTMLPSGVTTPIILKPDKDTYSESTV
jgi:hypothetical protein